jgi:hypothetical protein
LRPPNSASVASSNGRYDRDNDCSDDAADRKQDGARNLSSRVSNDALSDGDHRARIVGVHGHRVRPRAAGLERPDGVAGALPGASYSTFWL